MVTIQVSIKLSLLGAELDLCRSHLLILFSRNKAHLARWTLSEPSFIPPEETRLFIPHFYLYLYHLTFFSSRGKFCLAEDGSNIILVNSHRVLYELDLQRLNFKDGSLAPPGDSHQAYWYRYHRVSCDGCRVVAIHIRYTEWDESTTFGRRNGQSESHDFNKVRAELYCANLCGPADQIKNLEFEYSDPNLPLSHMHSVIFSPDLSILKVGPHIIDLLVPGHTQLSFPDSSLDKLQDGDDSCVSFSPCNKFLIIVEGKEKLAEDKYARLGLFRICLAAGKIERLAVAGLNELFAVRFESHFHPWLPLLLLTCIIYRGDNAEGVGNSIKVMELDLEALESVEVAIPKHGLGILGK